VPQERAIWRLTCGGGTDGWCQIDNSGHTLYPRQDSQSQTGQLEAAD
jgi:hypothetical protein